MIYFKNDEQTKKSILLCHSRASGRSAPIVTFRLFRVNPENEKSEHVQTLLRDMIMKKKIITVFILVVCVATYFLIPHIKIILIIKNSYSKDKTPYMYVVPSDEEIVNNKIGVNKYNNNYSFCNIKFKTPFKAITKNTSDDCQKNIKIIRFANCKSIIIDNGKTMTPKMKTMFAAINKTRSNMHTNNDFDIYNVCLNVTPDKISIFSSLGEKTKMLTLLLLKQSFTPAIDVIGIYKYKTNNISSFRFDLRDNRHIIYLFNSNNNYIANLSFYMFTVEEIDNILSSCVLNI
jgi:hypothetical protein